MDDVGDTSNSGEPEDTAAVARKPRVWSVFGAVMSLLLGLVCIVV